MLLLLSAPVQPLVGELGSRKPRGVAKKNFSIKKIKVNKRPEETSHLNSHYTDASKHIKRCSTSYTIRERQIKTAMTYHYTPIRMAKIQNTENIKCLDEDAEQTANLIPCW